MTAQEQLNLIRETLKTHNGRRRERTLDCDDVLAAITRARTNQGQWVEHVGMVGGGNVANAYGYRSYQTVCVAVLRTDGKVRVGLAVTSASTGSSLTTCTTGLSRSARPEQFREWADMNAALVLDAYLPEQLAHEAACRQHRLATDTPAEIVADFVLEHAGV